MPLLLLEWRQARTDDQPVFRSCRKPSLFKLSLGGRTVPTSMLPINHAIDVSSPIHPLNQLVSDPSHRPVLVTDQLRVTSQWFRNSGLRQNGGQFRAMPR
ncbi:hypothetical protein E2C01_001172 [Portunus trituberculatus]|uniref:Uncharacterized protein n=1 Tax=Portunus trituberculatus TaxID=210409 RepID=A0A5B7CIQ8_PORTR|nr:hypothetical protein [Portunus trituberculatus]